MTRLFRLKNRAGTAWWVMAVNYEDAVNLSLTTGRARSSHNIELVGDQTDFYLRQQHTGKTLRRLLDGDARGFGSISVPSRVGGSISQITRPLSPEEQARHKWNCTWPGGVIKPDVPFTNKPHVSHTATIQPVSRY
jgi:hypothetical protein